MPELNDDTRLGFDDDAPIISDEENARRIFAPHPSKRYKRNWIASMPKSRWPPPNENVAIWIDRDIVEYFTKRGGWKTGGRRLNDTLASGDAR